MASDNDNLNFKGWKLHRTDHPPIMSKEMVHVTILGES